jgi:peptide/nickel transport system substrate-binding protein
LYEPLFQVDDSFQAVPVLCQSYTVSEDKLVWTFTLRAGVTFSDGSPLTGTVVAAALNLARQSDSRYAERLAHVTAITGSEEQVTIVLNRPNGNLPLLLDIPIALDDSDYPAGTGPYVFTEDDSGLSLTARAGWWQGLTLPSSQILLRSVSKSDELIFAFGAGNVSLVDVDLMGTNALGYSGNYETWDYTTTDLLYLGFNAQKGVCRTAAVRKALALAADRASIAQTTYASHAVAATLPVHPNSGLYDDALAQELTYAPAGLADQLTELKVSGRTLILLVNSENTAKVSAAQRIAYQLEAVGMKIDLRQLTFEDYTAALKAGNFDLYLGEVVLTADFDLSPLLSEGGALNYGGWSSGEIAGLLSAFLATEGENRTSAAAALFQHLNQEVPIAPLCFKNGSVLTQWGRLSGLSPVRNNVFYQLENWSLQSK